MNTQQSEQIKQAVRERYGAIAVGSLSNSSCCGEETPQKSKKASPCCPTKDVADPVLNYTTAIGYSKEEISAVPAESNMALGCGNPTAIANLKEGEVVLDLGSGGGFDCFLASQQVGEKGFVIGVDMTPEMVAKARINALKGNFTNVEFRLGEIEYIPAANSSVDAIISNCVINLSTDKPQVFREALRVLKPGGRLAISDVVLTAKLPDEILNDLSLYCSCTSGAISIEEYQTTLANAGFKDISIIPKEDSREFIREWREGMKLDDYLLSAIIEARKPL
ncbi:MAG: arsenite methyltransferase [Bacteroidetes bacterium]|nr:MAG: arsenite methyltransferase [Bacteroidota bacterium]